MAARAAFTQVVVLDDCAAGATEPQDIQAFLTLNLLSADSPVLGSMWSWSAEAQSAAISPHARLQLHLTLRSAKDNSTVDWDIGADAPFQFRYSSKKHDEDVARALSAALLSASARFLADLSENSYVRSWLSSQGAAEAARPASGPPVADNLGFAIMNDDSDTKYPLADCVASALTHSDKRLRVMSVAKARETYFPWLDPSVVSLDRETAAALLSKPLIQEQAKGSGLRYLGFLTQGARHSGMHGPFICGGGAGGAGCLGVGRLTRETTIGLIVWDLQQGRASRELSDSERAHDLVVGYVLPLWIPGGKSTRKSACQGIAQQMIQLTREPATPSRPATDGATPVSKWRSVAELSQEADAELAGHPINCLDAFIAPAGDSPATSDSNHTDGIQWFDGLRSVGDLVSPTATSTLTRFGGVTITERELIFTPAAGSEPSQTLRIPFSEFESATVDRDSTTLVLLRTKSDCHAALQVLDPSPAAVKSRTAELGEFLAQRLTSSKH